MVPGLSGDHLASMLPNALRGEVRPSWPRPSAATATTSPSPCSSSKSPGASLPNRFAAGAVVAVVEGYVELIDQAEQAGDPVPRTSRRS
jgi:hypothetical protein